MPYKRASNRDSLTTISEWRGTCSGKHYLLKDIFAELGLTATLMACTQYLSPDLASALPADVQALFEEGPVPDVHNYLVLFTKPGEMIVDATWPPEAAELGLPVNEHFVWGEDMQLACEPLEHFVVPERGNPQDYKQRLLATHFSPAEIARRDAFFGAIGV